MIRTSKIMTNIISKGLLSSNKKIGMIKFFSTSDLPKIDDDNERNVRLKKLNDVMETVLTKPFHFKSGHMPYYLDTTLENGVSVSFRFRGVEKPCDYVIVSDDKMSIKENVGWALSNWTWDGKLKKT